MPAQASDLTVVLISLVGGDALVRLERTIATLGVSYIVVDQFGVCVDANGLIVRSGAGRGSVPVRRRVGAEAAGTAFVAFLEDTVIPSETWLDEIMSAFGSAEVAAVGGPVLIAESLPARCRALGLTEYSKFDATFGGKDSDVSTLAGANFAFRTSLLLATMPDPEDALVDDEVFARLTRQGYKLVFVPAMAVRYVEPHLEGARLLTRFDHGRIYGSRACHQRDALSRAAFALKSFALPMVLTARHLRQAPTDFRISPSLIAWVIAFNLWWSAGELVGAAWGGTREGLDRWQ